MTNKLVEFFKSKIKIQVSNADYTKFINQCNKEKIQVWNVEINPFFINTMCYAKNYKKISKISKNLGGKTKVLQKRGLVFVVRKNKDRVGLVVGIVLVISILTFMQNFIWDIRVTTNDPKESEYIQNLLEDYGVKVGSFISNIDTRTVQQEILIDNSKFAWITLNIIGTKLEVDYTLATNTPYLEEHTPCNIVASKDGYIEKMSVIQGEAVVKEKYAVRKGDLLISGIKTYKDGNAVIQEAQGEVMARTYTIKEISMPLVLDDKIYTGEQVNKKSLYIFGINIPLLLNSEIKLDDVEKYGYDENEQYIPLTWFDTEIPIGINTTTYSIYEKTQTKITEKQAESMILDAFDDYEKNELNKVEILSMLEDKVVKDNKVTINRKYTSIEDISVKVKLNHIYNTQK